MEKTRRGVGVRGDGIEIGVGVFGCAFLPRSFRQEWRNRGPLYTLLDPSVTFGRRTHSEGVFRVFWGRVYFALLIIISFILFHVLIMPPLCKDVFYFVVSDGLAYV